MMWLARVRGHFASRTQQVREGSVQASAGEPACRKSASRIGIAAGAESEASSLVEFAFVVPLMCSLIFGMFWFAFALNNYMVLTDAVADGARAFAMSRGAETDPCAYAVQAANSEASTLNTSNITYSITWISGGTTNPPYTTTCSGITLNSQDVVQIQATYPVSYFLWLTNGTITLHAQTSELVQ